ncbi:hypothetical protein ABZZ79_35670 [Streptomyces sp. NPDC006458]|uniref:hypothetical protein n=1 Tax=Streptomyces sp. NPDC006458 TaxID=3154302 RepID=UPI0033B324C4
MTVRSLFWPREAAQDVHLVPGVVGPRLDHLLHIEDTLGNRRADNPQAGVTVSFRENFVAGAAGTAGVTVNGTTGEVTVTAPLSASPRLLDFLVVATVREGASTFTTHKRFHIHSSITRMWLTPDTLTVHQGVRRNRFTLLAEFADGLFGDLTAWCPETSPSGADRTFVRLSGSVSPAIVWTTSAAATTGVASATGLLTGAANTGNATITATLPAPFSISAPGTAKATGPWNTPVTLTLIDGPGFGALADSVNVLILPDGFTAADRAGFEKLARGIVTRLRKRRRTRPYDLLKDKFNYCMAWVESAQAGINAREVTRRSNASGTRAEARETDTAVPAGGAAAAVHIAAPSTPATNDLFLLNEPDSAFAYSLGERPAAERFSEMRVAVPHPSRFDEQDFDDFLGALRDPAGTTVGGNWVRGGKDEDRILMLVHTRRNGGGNRHRSPSGRTIGMTTDDEDHHRIEDATGGLGKNLLPDTIPTVHLDAWTTAAHELGHSMALQDEYGGGGALPATRVASLASVPNVQPRSTLLTGGNLDADKVKWRWPRLRRAGVLDAQPADLGGSVYRVMLEAGHANQFVVGDVVRFRRRPLVSAPAPSDRFIVTSVADPEMELEALTAAVFTVADFPAGSLLICPVRAPDPDPATRVFGDDLELLHTTVRARINATRNPLNAADGAPANQPCTGAGLPTPTPATNFAAGTVPSPPRFSSWIVGLYENGVIFDCDVYRPTGICIMRRQQFGPPGAPDQAYQFCPVCRYAMVDLLDPTQHGRIDIDYGPRYPT